jgi:hypothetical protein
MKKHSVFLLFALLLSAGLHAQSNWEIGVRFGNDFSVEATIPFKAPRLHPAVYFDREISAGLYFDWLFALQGGPVGLKFYPGVGPEVHFYEGLDIAAAGNFGMEYSFGFPLTVGIDWRPNVMLTDQLGFNANRWGIFARFRFGEGVKFVRTD